MGLQLAAFRALVSCGWKSTPGIHFLLLSSGKPVLVPLKPLSCCLLLPYLDILGLFQHSTITLASAIDVGVLNSSQQMQPICVEWPRMLHPSLPTPWRSTPDGRTPYLPEQGPSTRSLAASAPDRHHLVPRSPWGHPQSTH